MTNHRDEKCGVFSLVPRCGGRLLSCKVEHRPRCRVFVSRKALTSLKFCWDRIKLVALSPPARSKLRLSRTHHALRRGPSTEACFDSVSNKAALYALNAVHRLDQFAHMRNR